MSEEVDRVGPFVVVGPAAWTFAAGFWLILGALFCYAVLVIYGQLGRVWPCDIAGRLNATITLAAGAGGACLGVAACESPAMRTVVGIAAGIVLALLAWWGVAAVFAPHC